MPVAIPLVEISVLAVVWACIELALLIAVIMDAVILIVKGVPVVGKYLAGPLDTVKQAITNALGKAEAGVDAAIGASWHLLASLLTETWHVIRDNALGYAALAEYVARLVYAHSGLSTLVHGIEHVVHGIEHGVRDLVREWRGIEHRVQRLEHDLTRGIGHDLHVGLRDVERELHGIERGAIPDLRRGIKAAEGATTQLGDFIKAIPGVNYIDWATNVVLAALGLTIVNMLRCPQFLRSAKNRGCGLWDGLENMLGLLFDALIFADFCDLLPEVVTLFGELEAPLVDLMGSAADSVCAQPPPGWVLIESPPLYGPDVNDQAQLLWAA